MADIGNGDLGFILQGSGLGSNTGPTFEALGVNSDLTMNGVLIAQGYDAFIATSSGTSGQVLTSNGAAPPTFQAPSSGGFTWTNVSTDTVMAAGNGYTTDGATTLNLTLPVGPKYGDLVRVVGLSFAGWKIVQNAGQVIHYGNVNTTVGTSGFIQSTGQYDSVELLCTADGTDFTVISGPQGNITYN